MGNLKKPKKQCITSDTTLWNDENCNMSDNNLYDKLKVFHNMFCNEDNSHICLHYNVYM